MSIFVNPLQFGPSEDFSRYPRPIEEDARSPPRRAWTFCSLLLRRRCTGDGTSDHSHRGHWEPTGRARCRPGHFDGVLTVVAKLFNIVQPDVAVFGRKDLQQASLIQAMVRDLDFPLVDRSRADNS